MSAVEAHPFDSIAVLGPGLIGGSILRAVRQRFPRVELRAWARRAESVDRLRAEPDLVDLASGSLGDIVDGTDLVILAMPTGGMREVVEQIGELRAQGSPLVTDVGSVKAPVMDEVAPLVERAGSVFVGSHPMAGSEKAGLEHADPNLFVDAAVILTASPEHDEEAARLSRWWGSLGARVSMMSAVEHDELVASISHLPHLLASALVGLVLTDAPELAEFCGGGFRDTTRVAEGPDEMWSGILTDNRAAVSARLERYIEELEQWKEALDSLDRERLRRFLSRSRKLRELLR